MRLDADFRALMPKLTQDEYSKLEQHIINEGCRDALVIWDDILIDGYNRYEICQKHNIEFKTISMQFDNRDAASDWIIDNQLGKRNLTVERKNYLIGKKYKQGKKAVGRPQEKLEQNVPIKSTAEKIAEEYNVTHMTVKRAEKFADAVDVIAENVGNEVRDAILACEIDITSQDVKKLAKQKPQVQKKVIEGCQAGKTIKQILKEARIEEKKEEVLNEAEGYKNRQFSGTLLEGDLFEVIDKVTNQSIDLIVTDPPYFVTNNDWDDFKSIDDYMDFTEQWLDAVIPKLKPSGRIYFFFAPEYHLDLCALLKQRELFGLNWGNLIIWEKKNNNKMFGRHRYRINYESIFYLYGQEASELNFTDDTFGETQTCVWSIATPQSNFNEGKLHETQKPLELYKRIIDTGSNFGNTVMDCFAGSGTCGIVCEELKRKWIMIENNPEYISIIKGRLCGLKNNLKNE